MSYPRRALAALLSVGFLVGTQLTPAHAEEAGPGLFCSYNFYHCTYPDGSYWSDCDPTFTPGYIWTWSAASICKTWTAA